MHSPPRKIIEKKGRESPRRESSREGREGPGSCKALRSAIPVRKVMCVAFKVGPKHIDFDFAFGFLLKPLKRGTLQNTHPTTISQNQNLITPAYTRNYFGRTPSAGH